VSYVEKESGSDEKNLPGDHSDDVSIYGCFRCTIVQLLAQPIGSNAYNIDSFTNTDLFKDRYFSL